MSDTGGNAFRDEIVAKIRTVPAMPSSAAKVITLIQNPDVEISELVETLEYDPGLTANVLRWGNSVYFGGRHEITSVRDAIVRMGMKQMSQLVMTSIAAPIVGQQVRGYDLAPGSLLEHSIAVAIGTEELAKTLGFRPPDHAFTSGLLHDIGKIVLGTFVDVASEPIVELAFESQVTFDEAERRTLGIDHAEVGAILLERWNIPKVIVDVVRWHHEPGRFTGDTLALDLVHVAEIFSIQSGLGAGIDGLHYRPADEVVARLEADAGLKLKPLVAESVSCKMLSGLEDVREVLSTQTASPGAS